MYFDYYEQFNSLISNTSVSARLEVIQTVLLLTLCCFEIIRYVKGVFNK